MSFALLFVRHFFFISLCALIYIPIHLCFVAFYTLAEIFTITFLFFVSLPLLFKFGPARNYILQQVGLLDYNYVKNLGSASFKVQHKLDTSYRTIKCQYSSNKEISAYSMVRQGLIGGFGQRAATGMVSYCSVWNEEYHLLWFPIVRCLFDIPIWHLIALQKTASNRYYWQFSVNPEYVEYLTYRYEYGNLVKNISNLQAISFENLLTFMKKMAASVQNVHNEGHYHGKIKPQNVFIRHLSVHSMLPVLSEPAVANYFEKQREPYQAPELLNPHSVIGRSTDIYSLGQLFQLLIDKRQGIPKSLEDLISTMILFDENARPDIQRVIQCLNDIEGTHD